MAGAFYWQKVEQVKPNIPFHGMVYEKIKRHPHPTESKREVPDGLWFKVALGKIIHTRELKNNAYVVPEEDHHVRIGSQEYSGNPVW